jgi:hypothetical protein
VSTSAVRKLLLENCRFRQKKPWHLNRSDKPYLRLSETFEVRGNKR